jgi:hypothetical protein
MTQFPQHPSIPNHVFVLIDEYGKLYCFDRMISAQDFKKETIDKDRLVTLDGPFRFSRI